MKSRFTLFRRGDVFYCQDTTTGKQTSLRTADKAEAHTLLNAKNEAHRQPRLNLELARTYLSTSGGRLPAAAARPSSRHELISVFLSSLHPVLQTSTAPG